MREDRVKGSEGGRTWCISTVTTPPALAGHLAPAALVPPTLQRMSAPPTLVTGLLDMGRRAHWEPWSRSACVFQKASKGGTYHVDAVDPELLEGGMRGSLVGSA